MAKIVIDAREFTTSTGRYISKLVLQLEALDAEHDYTVLLYPKDMERYQPTNPRFHKLACPYEEFSFGEQLGFARQLHNLKADLVHFGMPQQPLLYRGRSVTTIHDLTTLRFRNPTKNPLVFTIKQIIYRVVVWYAAHKSKHVLADSEFVRQDVAKSMHVSPDKISVALCAADEIKEAADPLPDLQNKKFIMYVGRPTPHKNLPRLIDAFQQLQAQRPDLYLVLAGRKDANYLLIEKLVQKKGLRQVVFTDFISDGQLRWLYENCAAYVFPSLSEGFGLPGLEAMIEGAPVVSSNATCLPEVYGDAAHYFDPRDVSEMAAKIGEVLDDPILREDLIDKGKQQAARYSWRRMAEETLAVYNQALTL